ncbi:hypothetical protein T4B_648 [Trichinella pseudospiralis]|uniref:Uncharacterized protein n=1 Tax=Trichinella pseudospiralis TaxID=6337 RepID=A0A0V1HIE6_TRIPS|nr:hypothetical protein T4B_648 [Trichinella pseudospiralis]
MNKPAIGLSNYELSKMGIHFPYASVVALEETNTNGKWQLMPNVLPPISFLDFKLTLDKEAPKVQDILEWRQIRMQN